MFKKNKVFGLLIALMVIVLIAGCTPETIIETVEVEKEVVVTKEVEVEKEVVVTKEVEVEVEVTPEVPEGDTIVIGGVGPLSAPGSYASGTQMRQAAEMAVDEFNEAGGVLGKQVELIFGDTEGLPERGTAVTERLITQNHVVGIVGEYHSGVSLTEMEVVHKYGVPAVFAEPWTDELTASGYPEVFRLAPSIEYFSGISTRYIAEVGWESVVFVLEDTDYGHSQGDTWVSQLEDYGITDVEVIYADPATEDFTPILQRIQQDPPEMLAGVITGIGNSRLVRQACELGLAPTAETAYYASLDAQYEEFWENAGDCGQYVFFTYIGLPESIRNDTTKAFLANFEERYDHVPGAPAMETYDATYMLLTAIENAGSTEPEAIIKALEEIEITGTLGDLWFEYTSANPVPDDVPAWMWHQYPTPSVYIMQYTEVGQTVDEAFVVFPVEVANGPLYTSP